MSPAQGSNAQALKTLKDRIDGMKMAFEELRHISNTTPDLQLRSTLRPQLDELNEKIAFFEAQRDAVAGSVDVVTAPSAEEIADVQNGLRKLDGFVRSDQNAHASVDFLQQVLAQLKG